MEPQVPESFLHRLLERGHRPATNAEHLEEAIPERLPLSGLARFAFPFRGERDGSLANFVPRKRHGRILSLVPFRAS